MSKNIKIIYAVICVISYLPLILFYLNIEVFNFTWLIILSLIGSIIATYINLKGIFFQKYGIKNYDFKLSFPKNIYKFYNVQSIILVLILFVVFSIDNENVDILFILYKIFLILITLSFFRIIRSKKSSSKSRK